MRRGDIRTVLLATLLDGPAHGYEVMRRLEERSGGMWRPSAGSVYPTLQMLEEEGLLSSTEDAGKRVYALTDTGRVEAERRAEGFRPWEDSPAGGRAELRQAVGALMMALRQVEMAADDVTVERATALVSATRQQLYQLLAES